MEDKIDKSTPRSPKAVKNSSQEIKSEFEEPKLIELGNLRDMTGMPFSQIPI